MRPAAPILTAALILAAASAGCASLPLSEAPLLVVRDTVWVNATGNATLTANLGPHCAQVAYGRDPPKATLYARGALLPPAGPSPGAVVVREYDARGNASLATVSTGVGRLYTPDGNGTVRLESPVDADRALFNVTVAAGGGVRVNGALLAPGENWTAAFRYEGVAEGAEYAATHHVRVEHLGVAEVRSERTGLCD